MDRPAATAPVFGTANTQNPQPRRDKIEHLVDRLADDMERAAGKRLPKQKNENERKPWRKYQDAIKTW